MVRLGLDAVDQVRRRVRHDTLDRRWHADDPLFGIRRLLCRGHDHHSEQSWARILAGSPPATTVSRSAGSGVEANLVVAAWTDDPEAVAGRAARAGIQIARGLGPTAGRAVRVGLLDRTATDPMVDRLLAALAG